MGYRPSPSEQIAVRLKLLIMEVKFRSLLIILAVCAMCLTACGRHTAVIDEPDLPDVPELPDTVEHVALNVLALGNSYCNDAYSYVPYVMHNVAPEVELTIAFLSVGGCYLERHYKEFCLQNKPYLYYYRHGPADVSWIKRDSVRLSEVLGERDWDIILFQQASGFSDDYSTYQPYVTQLLEWFDERLAKPHTYGWLMTPAYPDGLDRLGDKSSEQMYGEIADCARRVMEDTDIGFLIPAGTAIQNARHTSLDALGAFGHLSADGVHYHDGIPRLIESYAVVQTLLEHLGLERDINNDMLAITKQWLIEMNIERSWNAPTEVTEANRTLAKKCVNAAMREPFRVTVVAE